ncbi:hypothetical protein ACV1EB_21710, partial [Aeromonas caviae]
MVSKIKLPEENSIEILKGVLSERQKHRPFYNRIENDLITQAQNFIEHHGNPAMLTPLHVQDLKRRVHLKRLPRSCSVSTFSA